MSAYPIAKDRASVLKDSMKREANEREKERKRERERERDANECNGVERRTMIFVTSPFFVLYFHVADIVCNVNRSSSS